jgi:hypothetical protein
MMARCYSPEVPGYLHYGARGVRVCGRWHDFRLFLEDIDRLIGSCPPGMTLDRIHPDDNYGPGKVRWASRSTQNRNKRKRPGMTSQYIGVSWAARDGRWRAQISIDSHVIVLGRFESEKQAHEVYQAALRSIEP